MVNTCCHHLKIAFVPLFARAVVYGYIHLFVKVVLNIIKKVCRPYPNSQSRPYVAL